ncbi:hypothetical protein [Curtobacterium sp. L1-20]|uniref:hypothetical protein n=1 Tax=Curtobacterium sp. L1-20 TaxID=3138181 RepID=UPI003B5235C6
MSAWDVRWSDPVVPGPSVVSCELTRRGDLAHGVEVELSTTDSDAREMLWQGNGPQRPLAENGTYEFEVPLPGTASDDVVDGPVKFSAPRNSDDSALVVTVYWSDAPGGPRREQSFTYRP